MTVTSCNNPRVIDEEAAILELCAHYNWECQFNRHHETGHPYICLHSYDELFDPCIWVDEDTYLAKPYAFLSKLRIFLLEDLIIKTVDTDDEITCERYLIPADPSLPMKYWDFDDPEHPHIIDEGWDN